jgi:hypothetical protein
MRDSQIFVFSFLTITFGILSYLAKVTTLPVVLVPMGYLTMKRIWETLNEEKYRLRQYIKSNIDFLMWIAGIFLIPILPFYCWLQYTDTLKAASEFTTEFTSANLSVWNFGTWAQKTTVANWLTIMQRITSYVITYPGLVFLIFGPVLYLQRSKKHGE